MTTITIQANNIYAIKLYRKLKEDKNLEKLVLEKNASASSADKEILMTMPGEPVDDDILLRALVKASREKNIPSAISRNRTKTKIAAWRRNR